MTTPKLDQAREWADTVMRYHDTYSRDEYAAAEVIAALPDQWMDAEKVRNIIHKNTFCGAVMDHRRKAIIEELEDLLDPPLPTLADMTPEEREACKWMQCEVDGVLTGVIIHVGGEKAIILWRSGMRTKPEFSRITPRPDLDGLAWPAQVPQPECRPKWGPITLTPPTREEEDEVRGQFEEPTLADLISPEDVPPGEPWSVRYYGKEWAGVRADDDRAPWSIISMDGLDYRDVDDSEVTLMFRLVPETP